VPAASAPAVPPGRSSTAGLATAYTAARPGKARRSARGLDGDGRDAHDADLTPRSRLNHVAIGRPDAKARSAATGAVRAPIDLDLTAGRSRRRGLTIGVASERSSTAAPRSLLAARRSCSRQPIDWVMLLACVDASTARLHGCARSTWLCSPGTRVRENPVPSVRRPREPRRRWRILTPSEVGAVERAFAELVDGAEGEAPGASKRR
jgi:hypothetical protein